MNFTRFQFNRKNSRKGIIRSISLNDNRAVGNPVMKNGSGRKCRFKKFKGNSLLLTESKGCLLPGESGEGNNDIRKIKNEPPIKISKAKEGLNLPDLARFRPILKNFYFRGIHEKAIQSKDVA